MFVQINTVKYDANWEITNTCEKLQIVWSQFFTNKLIFVYIQSNLNFYLFISIQIRLQWIQTNSYLTICNIRSAIQWATMKVILNCSMLPSMNPDSLWRQSHPFQERLPRSAEEAWLDKGGQPHPGWSQILRVHLPPAGGNVINLFSPSLNLRANMLWPVL